MGKLKEELQIEAKKMLEQACFRIKFYSYKSVKLCSTSPRWSLDESFLIQDSHKCLSRGLPMKRKRRLIKTSSMLQITNSVFPWHSHWYFLIGSTRGPKAGKPSCLWTEGAKIGPVQWNPCRHVKTRRNAFQVSLVLLSPFIDESWTRNYYESRSLNNFVLFFVFLVFAAISRNELFLHATCWLISSWGLKFILCLTIIYQHD